MLLLKMFLSAHLRDNKHLATHFSDVFRGYKKDALGTNGSIMLNMNKSHAKIKLTIKVIFIFLCGLVHLTTNLVRNNLKTKLVFFICPIPSKPPINCFW